MERRPLRSSSPARRPIIPEGQTALQTTFPRDNPKSGAPTLKRFCPAGANSVDPARRQRPLPLRGKAASPNARLRRRQAPAPEPAAVCPPAAPFGTKQSAQAPCSWGLGASAPSQRLLAAGPPGRWASGPLGLRAAGPPGRWASGPLGLRAAGPPGRWASGPLGLRAAGPPGRWASGPLGLRAAGPPGRWASGLRVAPCSCGARSRRASVENAVLPLVLSYCTLFCHFFRRKNMQWGCGCIPFCALARKE